MSLFERSSTHSAPESSPTHQPDPKAIWLSPKTTSRLAVLTATVATILCVPVGSHVLAKSGQQPEAKAASSTQASSIDPDAIDAVKKMAAYLHTLKSYQVIDSVTQDDVLEDGLIVQSNSKVDYLLARPNRMRIEVTADDQHRLYLYDGKNFTIWARLVNYYATVPAPPTIGELLDVANEKYD